MLFYQTEIGLILRFFTIWLKSINYIYIFFKTLSQVSNTAQCLINVPIAKPSDSNSYPGLYWNANDQCKMIYGNSASFCVVTIF